MCDASHPAVLQLDAEAFASPPALRTFVADKGDGTYEVQLLWSPSGERGTGGNKHDGEVEVGKLEFHGGCVACMRGPQTLTHERTNVCECARAVCTESSASDTVWMMAVGLQV